MDLWPGDRALRERRDEAGCPSWPVRLWYLLVSTIFPCSQSKSHAAVAGTMPWSSTPPNLPQVCLLRTSKAASSMYGNCAPKRSLTRANKDVTSNGAVLGDADVPITEARGLFSADVGAGESRLLLPHPKLTSSVFRAENSNCTSPYTPQPDDHPGNTSCECVGECFPYRTHSGQPFARASVAIGWTNTCVCWDSCHRGWSPWMLHGFRLR